MAKKDWKKALQDAIDAVGDRLRGAFDALDELVGLQPELAPVPVRPGRPDDRRRRH